MKAQTMRDTLISEIYQLMGTRDDIFLVSADMGAPSLDRLRSDFRNRFINVGIAEQNLINVSAGLALEGFIVYAYALAPFIMRAYEQVRINLALSSQIRTVNVNLIGVGCGISYDVSGPTHHCLEDITIMRVLPNIEVLSPSDSVLSKNIVGYTIECNSPKYIRLDGKPLLPLYFDESLIDFHKGFHSFKKGKKVCVISTGFMTQWVSRLLEKNTKYNIGHIDVFRLKPFNEGAFLEAINGYDTIITCEEAFIEKGGLDMLILDIVNKYGLEKKIYSLGFKDEYIFKLGDRAFLYNQSGITRARLFQLIDDNI